MNRPAKPPLPLGVAILLLILATFVVVAVFGALVIMFIIGAKSLGLPPAGYVAVVVLISGVFAWLVKRLSEAVSEWGRQWFPEDESDELD
jgi:membrane protein implicated in regulation of membrane protease activity